MKSSTLFGLTLALLVGLGVVVGGKYLGYLNGISEKKNGSSAGPQVLVAHRNLFKGIMPTAADVKARSLAAYEVTTFEKNRSKFLPPIPQSVESRVLAMNVPAGTPLMEEHFEKQAIPEPISERLETGMRSVNLVLPRERAAGGVIQVGERVDVLFTTSFIGEGQKLPQLVSAPIAKNLKVIIKRDSLWKVLTPVNQEKPATFTLQANPYRAALIEFAKMKGVITLVPAASKGNMSQAVVAAASLQQQQLDPMQQQQQGGPNTAEDVEEEQRVLDFLANRSVISDADLERIFSVRIHPRPVISAKVEPEPQRVEMMIGTHVMATAFVENDLISSRKGQGAVVAERAKASANDQKTGPAEDLEFASTRFMHPDNCGSASGLLASTKKG